MPPTPPNKAAKDIAINFTMVDFHGSVNVYDIWEQKSVGAFTGSYTVRTACWPLSMSAEGAFANAGQGGAVPRQRLPAPLAGVEYIRNIFLLEDGLTAAGTYCRPRAFARSGARTRLSLLQHPPTQTLNGRRLGTAALRRRHENNTFLCA